MAGASAIFEEPNKPDTSQETVMRSLLLFFIGIPIPIIILIALFVR